MADEITADGLIIKDNVVIGCNQSATNVTIPSGVTAISYRAFQFCRSLVSVEIPESVVYIEAQAFEGCSSLSKINIPEGVTDIGSNAFFGCNSLKSVSIPNSVISIGTHAFVNCNSLQSVYMGEIPPDTKGERIFGHYNRDETWLFGPSDVTLYVPKGCKTTYSSLSWVTQYGHIYGINYGYCFRDIVEIVSPEDLSTVDNTLYMESAELYCGIKHQLAVKMKNKEANITAFSFDMQLPEGLSVAKDEEGNLMVELAEERKTSSHIVSANVVGEGLLKVIAVSTSNKCFSGTDGDILYITVEPSDNMTPDNYNVPLENITLIKADKSEETIPYSHSDLTLYGYLFGDVNRDGVITISDAIGIINIWLHTDMTGLYPEAADANRDNSIDVADGVTVINIVLNEDFGSLAPARRGAARSAQTVDPLFEVQDQYIGDARNVAMPIALRSGANEITALQSVIELPQGVTLSDIHTQSSHQAVFQQQLDGTVRVLCLSLKNETFDLEQPALTLEIECASDFNMGAVKFSDVKLTDVLTSSFVSPEVEAVLSRDATALDKIKVNGNPTQRYDLQGRRIDQSGDMNIYIEQGMIKTETELH